MKEEHDRLLRRGGLRKRWLELAVPFDGTEFFLGPKAKGVRQGGGSAHGEGQRQGCSKGDLHDGNIVADDAKSSWIGKQAPVRRALQRVYPGRTSDFGPCDGESLNRT